MRFGAAAANAGWFVASLPEWQRFRRATRNLETTQRRLLERYLQSNANTDFGLEYDFAKLKTWEDYSKAVPTRDYEDFRPYVERIAADEHDVLTADRVTLLEPSSGSSGAEKWVPYRKNT